MTTLLRLEEAVP